MKFAIFSYFIAASTRKVYNNKYWTNELGENTIRILDGLEKIGYDI